MVISPGCLKAMSQVFDGSGAAGRPQNDADCGCAKTSDHPKNVLHGDPPDPLMFVACLSEIELRCCRWRLDAGSRDLDGCG
jgi:hypothetical protein